MAELLQVVAGALTDPAGRVLLAQRTGSRHLAGLWEFPGGKCEPGEGLLDALCRELHEELGIEVLRTAPLISVPWRYPQQVLRLDVLRVSAWKQIPQACEGQALRWQYPHAIDAATQVPADWAACVALQLPPHYLISKPDASPQILLQQVHQALAGGARLLQLRLPCLPATVLRELAMPLQQACQSANASLLLNGHVRLAQALGTGLHLPARQLMRFEQRPIAAGQWLAASCHDSLELAQAARIGCDFATLSPVLASASHPQAAGMGWEAFARCVAEAPLPVYALGGMTLSDLDRARSLGAQGVAGIRAFW